MIFMAEPDPKPDSLSTLRQRVEAARKRGPGKDADQPPVSAASLALRMGGEFGAAVLVGALLGFGLDHFLHTSPWGLMVGLGLGFVTGIVNVTRAAQAYSAGVPQDSATRAPRDARSDDEEED